MIEEPYSSSEREMAKAMDMRGSKVAHQLFPDAGLWTDTVPLLETRRIAGSVLSAASLMESRTDICGFVRHSTGWYIQIQNALLHIADMHLARVIRPHCENVLIKLWQLLTPFPFASTRFLYAIWCGLYQENVICDFRPSGLICSVWIERLSTPLIHERSSLQRQACRAPHWHYCCNASQDDPGVQTIRLHWTHAR